jgi:hypothetical protein
LSSAAIDGCCHSDDCWIVKFGSKKLILQVIVIYRRYFDCGVWLLCWCWKRNTRVSVMLSSIWLVYKQTTRAIHILYQPTHSYFHNE